MARDTAPVSAGSNVASGVAAASASAVVAEARAGVPQAADSRTGRPKPSASDGITVTAARAVARPQELVPDGAGQDEPSRHPRRRGGVGQSGLPGGGQFADDEEIQVESGPDQLAHRRDQPLGALADVAPAHGQHEGTILECAQVPPEVLAVGAVGGREERGHAAPDGHDPVGIAAEQLDGLRPRVLGIGQHQVGGRHPRGARPVPVEMGLGGEVAMRGAQRDEVVQGHDAGQTQALPVRGDDEARGVDRGPQWRNGAGMWCTIGPASATRARIDGAESQCTRPAHGQFGREAERGRQLGCEQARRQSIRCGPDAALSAAT